MRQWDEIVFGDSELIALKTAEWRKEKGFVTGWENFPEKLMLVITEVSEVNDGADAAVRALQMVVDPNDPSALKMACGELVEYVDNYMEEWIDVMVRVMDIAGSCGIPVTIKPRNIEEPADLRTILIEHCGERSKEVMRLLSKGMEVFRDIVLGAVRPNQIIEMGELLSGVLSVSAGGVHDLGRSWKTEYAKKMKANEKRKPKHGRQR